MTSTAALVPGHEFTSHSGPGGSRAACWCGHPFNWETRDEDHARHLLAVAWAAGFGAGEDEQLSLYWDAASLNQPNPYED